MIIFAVLAFTAGILVSLSRQLNGRLSLSTSALNASFWNHLVGLAFLTLIALTIGGLFDGEISQAPHWAYWGGTIGVVFIGASSWLVAKLGAVSTAMLIIAGQMISGVALDMLRDAPGSLTARIIGVTLILVGMWLLQSIKHSPQTE